MAREGRLHAMFFSPCIRRCFPLPFSFHSRRQAKLHALPLPLSVRMPIPPRRKGIHRIDVHNHSVRKPSTPSAHLARAPKDSIPPVEVRQ